MSFLQQAFEVSIEGVERPEQWFLCLIESRQVYGGPEEGGWWITDSDCIAYREYPTREMAEAAMASVERLAGELEAEARSAHGEHCLLTTEWLDARGLDADFLPEPDGPSEYHVAILNEILMSQQGCRQYQ